MSKTTVARCLKHFKQEYAWMYRIWNTPIDGYKDEETGVGIPGYTKYKDVYSRRHAYKLLMIYIRDLSLIQLKQLYKKIDDWLRELIQFAEKGLSSK